MKQRCQNPRSEKFPSYGAVGIEVCPQWQTFDGFFKDMGHRPRGMTLDRVDGSKGYEPGNCRWATIFQQQNNQKKTVRVQYEGKQFTLSELSLILGISKTTLSYRIKTGWDQSMWGSKANLRK